jgi:hypothetical protein
MALDYLTIPGMSFFIYIFRVLPFVYFFVATSVDVKQVFSCGHLLLLHVRSSLTTQTTRTILCPGCWSLLGLVKDKDVLPVARLPDGEGDEEELEDG